MNGNNKESSNNINRARLLPSMLQVAVSPPKMVPAQIPQRSLISFSTNIPHRPSNPLLDQQQREVSYLLTIEIQKRHQLMIASQPTATNNSLNKNFQAGIANRQQFSRFALNPQEPVINRYNPMFHSNALRPSVPQQRQHQNQVLAKRQPIAVYQQLQSRQPVHQRNIPRIRKIRNVETSTVSRFQQPRNYIRPRYSVPNYPPIINCGCAELSMPYQPSAGNREDNAVQDVIVIEHQQSNQNRSRQSTAYRTTPAYLSMMNKKRGIGWGSHDFETLRPLLNLYFSDDRPMLRGYYIIIQKDRPYDLLNFLTTIGMAHYLQNLERLYANFFEFGKANAKKLVADSKNGPQICSRCGESKTALPENLLSALTEACNSSTKEITKRSLMKVADVTCDDLNNNWEQIFVLTKHNIECTSPPKMTIELQNAIESSFNAAKNYITCSIIWNSEPLKYVMISTAVEFYKLKLLTEDEKNAIIKNSRCEHTWVKQ